jgi:glycosyltransferase involved in cell wall biosynthesis
MSRDYGLKHAKGDIVMFLDADDYLDNKAFKIINDKFNEYPNLDILSFNFYRLYVNNVERQEKMIQKYDEFEISLLN